MKKFKDFPLPVTVSFSDGITLRRVTRDMFYTAKGKRKRIRSEMVEVVLHEGKKEHILISAPYSDYFSHWHNAEIVASVFLPTKEKK